MTSVIPREGANQNVASNAVSQSQPRTNNATGKRGKIHAALFYLASLWPKAIGTYCRARINAKANQTHLQTVI